MATDSPSRDTIFCAAIEIAAAEDRAAYIARACGGDEALRAEVHKLVEAHFRAGSFLEESAHDPRAIGADEPAPEANGTEQPGLVLAGRYKLLEAIGEGGMGTVWMAQQTTPVKRLVAVKLIKTGMDSKTVLARFEVERQAVALMDHPNIAKVHDAGTTNGEPGGVSPGRPFFVMELIKGVPITKYCDEQRLSLRQRLELMVPVCQAVQHAHHKGIIHRDLKPSNVLVACYDDRPAPKVIDFGVAKATGQPLTEQTLHTGFGTVVGTVEYMSPEQASFNQLDMDTRSDIYSLGVLLYELLTGTTPLDRKRLKERPFLEMLRLIREEEPPRPSTRLCTAETLPNIAANRGTEPKRLTVLVKGELDWIVMKALEKDRNRRYDTANSLARDIERHLHDEPVQACPPSAWYRFRKFIRRNRRSVLSASFVVIALVVGMIGTSMGLVEARQQRDAAAASAVTETKAKETAQAREAETEAILTFVVEQLVAAARPRGHGGLGQDVTLRRALEAALPMVEKAFKDQPNVELRVRRMLGLSFAQMGQAGIAAEQFQKARAIHVKLHGVDHPNTLGCAIDLANCYEDLGRHTDAARLREQTLALLKEKLGPDHPDTLGCMLGLANSYDDLGRHADAAKLHEEVLALRKARLGPDHPDTLHSMNDLSISYRALGRHADALRLREGAFRLMKARLGAGHRDTLAAMGNLANTYADLDRPADALRLREEVLPLMKDRLGPKHPDTLTAQHNLADSYRALGRFADALRLNEATLALRKDQLGVDHPGTLQSMRAVAASLVRLGRSAEAIPIIDECVRRATGKAVNPSLIPTVMSHRLRHFANARDAAGCRATAEMWENLKRTDPDSLYNAACMRAITAAAVGATDPSPRGARQADAEADRAMGWLRKAVDAGFTNVEHLTKDSDLHVLRRREDFKKLCADLEARQRTLKAKGQPPK